MTRLFSSRGIDGGTNSKWDLWLPERRARTDRRMARFRVPGDAASGRLSIRGCMSLPSDIEVWGTTFYRRGSMAKVLYSESKTGSPLEVLIKNSGVFRTDRPWWPSGDGRACGSP